MHSNNNEHSKVNLNNFKNNLLNFIFLIFKASLIERRDKAHQKHDEAKSLKDGIDRRSRTVTNILRKYLSNEQFEDYEHFVRMKSTLLMDAKDIEENISILDKQIEILNQISISDLDMSNNTESGLQTNSFKPISSTA